MNRRLSTYSIPISFLIIASLIYQLPVVGYARFIPASTNSSRDAQALFVTKAVPNNPAPDLKAANATASAPMMPFFAPSLTATLADDIGLGAKKNPGDTITYTAVITNGGASPADDATGMIFSAILDSNTTLVPGSVNAQPIAKPDSYTSSGNIPISIAAPGVLTNDIDPMTGTNTGLTVTEVQGLAGNVGVATNTTAVGAGGVTGSVTLANTGNFTYEPPPGYVGNDTFTYKTSEGTLTDTNTVTITISNMVWFIKNTGGGLNRGTFSNPFTTIASFNTANALADAAPNPKSGDIIALRSGTYSEADGINLRTNQKLIGEAIQFNTVFTADANSSTAYGTFAGATAAAPTINASAGNGVDLASSNTVRGLNVGNTSGFDFNGTAVGSPIINTVNVTGTGGAINVSTSGTFGATVSFGTLESSSSTGANINLVAVTGTLGITSPGTGLTGSAASSNAINISGGSVGFTYAGNVTKGSLGALLSVSGGHTGTLVFQTGALQATNGTGLQFDNADGTYSFNASCDLIGGDAGIDIVNGSSGTFTFGSAVNIQNPSGIGYREDTSTATVTDGGPITKTNNAASAVSINAKTGGSTTFNGGIVATTTTANAIDLTNTGGTVTFRGGLVVNTTSGVGFNAVGAGAIVSVCDENPCVVASTGPLVNTLTTTSGTALNVVNTNLGLTGLTFQSINVNGATNGIILNTTGTTSGTNGGLTVTGTSTTGGTGGTIQGNVQGALFTSTRDLVLKNMNFTNANSGNGVCQNVDNSNFNSACQAAINMNGVTNATFVNLNMDGGAQVGINGRSVSNLSILNSTVRNFGGGAAVNQGVNENDVRLFNLTGTCAITNSNFSFAAGDTTAGESLVDIRNDTGTLTLNVDGDPSNVNFNNFTNTQSSSDGSFGLTVTAVSSANTTVIVRRSKFLNIKTAGIGTFARGAAIMSVNITGAGNSANGNTFDPVAPNLGRAIDLNAQDTAQLNFNINENPKIYGAGGPIVNIFGTVNAQINGHIRNNPDMRGGGAGSPGSVIYFHPEDSADGRVEITNNVITNVGNDQAILLLNHGNGAALLDGVIDGIVANNTITVGNANNSAIYLNGGSNAGDLNKICGYVHNNTVTTTIASQFAFVVFVDTPGSHVYLQNFSVDATGTWNNPANGPNTETGPGGTAIQSAPTEAATAYSFNVGGACRTPTNAVAMFKVERNDRTYLAQKSDVLHGDNNDSRPAKKAMPRVIMDPLGTVESRATSNSAQGMASVTRVQPVAPIMIKRVEPKQPASQAVHSHHARYSAKRSPNVESNTTTVAKVRVDDQPLSPLSGETVTVNGAGSGFTLPGGDSVTITFQATVNTPPTARSVSVQGKVSGTNFTLVNGITTANPNTNDPETAAVNDATVTNINTTSTWTGLTNTDWNTFTNWSPNTYAPGVTNPAVSDVVIPNVGNQPTIGAAMGDVNIYSLNISNGRTLTIDPARILTIGGAPGGNLTLDGIITGGELRFGTGTHVINNAGGTGSLSATNLARGLSGSTTTLNNNLQAGAVAIDAGGSMTITGFTLSLNGPGAALSVGGTFTPAAQRDDGSSPALPPGDGLLAVFSTVVLNGSAAQTIPGITYSNLTIANTLGAHVTGVTLTGNATVNGILTLTSSDLATGANTLTMPNTATSAPATGATDVVGNVKRTGFITGGTALSFGNPLNTIRINFGTAPTDINVLLAKNAPATFASAVSRSYTITPTGGSSINATVRLHYRQAELNGNLETPTGNFNLRRFNGTLWQPVVPTSRNVGVVEDNWLENNTVTTFSEWTFANLSPSAAAGTISGIITTSNGTPVEGTVVRLSGDQDRKTITDAKGRYSFANVDINGFYTVTPSRVNYHFNPFNRAFTQLGNQTEAAFGAAFTGDNANPLDTPEYFVRQQYVDLLGREPDEGGFNYWSDELLKCGADAACVNTRRSDIAAAFFIEQEFQQTGAFIYNVYKSSLGRQPGYPEYTGDRKLVVGGPELETEKAAFAASFVKRAEFVEKYQSHTTGESFVDALLQQVWQTSNVDLGAQRGVLLGLYQTGGDMNQSRALVIRQLVADPWFQHAEYNPAFVLTEYFAYLRRNAEPEGYDFWLNVLNNREPDNLRGMVCSFITSAEYQNRFSSVVSHNNGECGR
jgi:hypothetical protein